jgi:two-component system CheB/CheR fusion protein
MRVLVWNRGAEDLWGLRREEAVGEHLLNLDIGLPVADLRSSVRSAMTEASYGRAHSLDAVNRKGRKTTIKVVVGALRGRDGQVNGAILTMEPTGSVE